MHGILRKITENNNKTFEKTMLPQAMNYDRQEFPTAGNLQHLDYYCHYKVALYKSIYIIFVRNLICWDMKRRKTH